MITVESLTRIELSPGDRVISSTQLHGYVLVFTKRGHVYQITPDGFDRVEFHKSGLI